MSRSVLSPAAPASTSLSRLPLTAETSLTVGGGGGTEAPWAAVTSVFEGPWRRDIALDRGRGGYFEKVIDGIPTGARYRLRLGDELHADPASRFQPDGPFGPSELIDPGTARWTDAGWQG